MKTQILVLDSDQGEGQANRFTVNLNDSIRGCVHSQLRQVILSGMRPASDYVYIRSGKLGSNVISSQGFGAFDVVPVSSPFRYERYSAAPLRNEFECGRLLNSIDVSIVNPDNSLVALTDSIRITDGSVLNVHYTSSYSDGSSSSNTFGVEIPIGDYSSLSLANAIEDALEPSVIPPINYQVSSTSNGINLAMDWTSLSSDDSIVVNGGELFSNLIVSFGGGATKPAPVILPAGNYSKVELSKAIVEALAPTLTLIKQKSADAQFTARLNSENSIELSLKWVPMSSEHILISDEIIIAEISIASTFTIAQPVKSASLPIKILPGVYSRAEFLDAVKEALQFTATSITDTFKHGDFVVDYVDGLLRVQLNWVCSSYNFYPLPAPLVSSVKLDVAFDDGTTRSTSGSIAGSTIAGNTYYSKNELLSAINTSLSPVALEMVASNNFDFANFTTKMSAQGVISIDLDWQCSSYQNLAVFRRTQFCIQKNTHVTYNMVVDNQAMWDLLIAFRPSTSANTTTSDYHWITIAAGTYSRQDVYNSIVSQLAGSGINTQLIDGSLEISATGTYYNGLAFTNPNTWSDTGVQYCHQDQTTTETLSITFTANSGNSSPPALESEDLYKLGLDSNLIYSSSPTSSTSSSLTLSFLLCPNAFPASITGVVGTMNIDGGNHSNVGVTGGMSLTSTQTSFLDNTFHRRSTWTFPSPSANMLVAVTPTFTLGGNGWILVASNVAEATPVQKIFTWDIQLPPVDVSSPQAVIGYNLASPLNSLVGLTGLAQTPPAWISNNPSYTVGDIVLYNGTVFQCKVYPGSYEPPSDSTKWLRGVNTTFQAIDTQFSDSAHMFKWTFPKALSFPSLTGVSAELTGTQEMGLTGAIEGAKTVFNTNQRRFNWVLHPASSNHSKSTVVIEITTI